jgi:hypothetical protein
MAYAAGRCARLAAAVRDPAAGDPIMTLAILAALAAAPLALVQAILAEWAFHALWLHRGWRPERCYVNHTLVHHQLCKFGDTFLVLDAEQGEGVDLPAWVAVSIAIVSTLPWAIAGLVVWLTGWDGPVWAFVASFAVSSWLYRIAHDRAHRLVHRPAGGRLERTAAFRAIERRHRIHHVRMDRNLNLLLPLGDRLFGTALGAATIPALTPLTARRMARRYSRYGRALAAATPRLALLEMAPPTGPARARTPVGAPQREPAAAAGMESAAAEREPEMAGRD